MTFIVGSKIISKMLDYLKDFFKNFTYDFMKIGYYAQGDSLVMFTELFSDEDYE